jgi:hypothetical protein
MKDTMKAAKGRIRRAAAKFHAFHVRYRWAFALIIVGSSVIVLFGAHELGKALFGLGLEQLLLHLGLWAKGGESAAVADAVEAASTG